ncbi:MAG TPA: type II toxin-antitoxin system prevent-host-death family antitoxin [Gammaproteobacteria bacterium]|nr:type II toxin-antitoxin system prevent-host-death family antitoxin [Gammaproteobacteria bacterium]
MLVNIHDAKTNFSKLINRALSGEEIIIAKDGTPLVTLTPYNPEAQKRKGGQFTGIMHVADDFDAPLPKDILDSFYKKE